MKKLIIVLFFAISILLIGCDFLEEKFPDEPESERTYNNVVYEMAFEEKTTYKDRHGSRSYTDYYMFDKDNNRFLMWYGSNKFCDIYEGKYEGILEENKEIKLFTYAPITYDEITIERDNRIKVHDVIKYINSCLENDTKRYHTYSK